MHRSLVSTCKHLLYKQISKIVLTRKIDIVLLFDQSNSMTELDYPFFRSALLNWTNHCLDGNKSRETQFAVMGCAVDLPNSTRATNVSLYFNGTKNQADDVTKIKKTHSRHVGLSSYKDNVEGCIQTAVEKIFVTANGDRPKHQTFFSKMYFIVCFFHKS